MIRALRVMDVPLSELRQILDVRRSGTCNCAVVKGSITDKIKSIDARVEELLATKAELARLLAMWRDCGGAKTSA